MTETSMHLDAIRKKSGYVISNELGRLCIITAVIFILMSSLNPQKFLTVDNMQSMTFQIAELGFFSVAMMFSMIVGGIDLSIVSIANLSGILASFILKSAADQNASGSVLAAYLILAVAVSLAVGIACGVFNGILISKFNVTPMLATLGTMNLYTGIAIVLTQGHAVSGFPDVFLNFGNGIFLGIAVPCWLLILTLALSGVILTKKQFGFRLRLVGSNPVASLYAGINNDRVIIQTYVFNGILCSVIGLEILSSVNSAKADYGVDYIFQTILCAVLAGTNPNGGKGSVASLVFALVSLQLLSSGFDMLQLGGYCKNFIWGILLLFVMVINFVLVNKKAR